MAVITQDLVNYHPKFEEAMVKVLVVGFLKRVSQKNL
jgi:hypothetical protein